MSSDQPVRPGRRAVLKGAAVGALGIVAGSSLQFSRVEAAGAAATPKPDIQFDVRAFLGPLRYFNADGTELAADAGNPLQFQFGPVHTKFVTFRLLTDKRFDPTKADARAFAAALDRLEAVYPFSPSGLFVFLAYGMPYFNRLPRSIVAHHMPRLATDTSRWAMEEAQPAPTDAGQPGAAVKPTFNVPVRITDYDILMTLRSDSVAIIDDTVAWLRGSNKLKGAGVASPSFKDILEIDTSSSLMVSSPGWPRQRADQLGLPYRSKVHPTSPMWMGFADQHRTAAGPPEIVTFQGNEKAKVTTAAAGDYFDNGSVQHFSHVILDLDTWYDRVPNYDIRAGYMFRHNPRPAPAYTDPNVTSPPTTGGGPSYIVNDFVSTDDARSGAAGEGAANGERNIGHTSALQRSSRTADGTPLHIRLDGPGFDSLDMTSAGVPAAFRGKAHPKLQFSIFVPSADFFATMRRNQSSQDLMGNGVLPRAQGLEFFTNTTRRQNFLVPPRRHRAMPLLDITREVTEAYDTKLGKLVSEDKKLYTLNTSDFDYWAVEAGATLTCQFEAGVPAGATIRKAFVFVRHYEESGIGANPLVFTIGGGNIRTLAVLGSTVPATFIDKDAQARTEWDVTQWINSPARANDLKFAIQNRSRQGKKSYVNNVYLWIDHS